MGLVISENRLPGGTTRIGGVALFAPTELHSLNVVAFGWGGPAALGVPATGWGVLAAGRGAAQRCRSRRPSPGCSQLSAAAAGEGGTAPPGVNLAWELKKEFLFWEKGGWEEPGAQGWGHWEHGGRWNGGSPVEILLVLGPTGDIPGSPPRASGVGGQVTPTQGSLLAF